MPLGTRISLAAQRVIRGAFEDLERTVSAGDSAEFRDTTLEDVQRACYDIEDHLAARQSLRNMRRLVPLFTGLQYYSRSIEVLCNGTPFLPWIWAPIKLILKVASDFVEAFEKIIKAYARIAEPLARFRILDQAYSRNVDIQQTLAIFYADILKFHKEAYKFVRRSSWKLFFLTSWGRFQRRFDGLIEDLKAQEELIDKTANAVNITEAKQSREAIELWRQESLDKLAKEEEQQTASLYLAIATWLKIDESDQHKIFDAIASEALSNPGTCNWALKQPDIVNWMRYNQEVTFLVLHGHPGTGKSVLATQIATFLRSDQQSLVVTHFCSYSYAASKDYEQILKSILLQLIRSNTDLVAYVYEALILKKKSVTSQVLEQLLRDLVGAVSLQASQTGYIHLILDGLDECDSDKQAKVISLLERLVSSALSSSSTVCKVLLSSRMSAVIGKKSKRKHTISLSDEKENLERAIRHYAKQRLEALLPRLMQTGINDADIKNIELRIAKKADGMFLWARLVLEYLATNMFFGRDEIIKAADLLPRKLSKFYAQILTTAISHFDDRSVARMRLILGWIAFAKRPLRKAEFRSALAYSTGDPEANELAPPYVFDMCAPLIEERRDSTFVFIHVSVKDFLQSSDSNVILHESNAIYEHGLATVTCLLSGLRTFDPAYADKSRCLRVLQGLHGFHHYATEYWVEYLILNSISADHNVDTNSKFFVLSVDLARKLRQLTRPSMFEDSEKNSASQEERLAHLRRFSELYEVARTVLLEQQVRYLEIQDIQDASPRNLIAPTSLKSLLLSYQHTIKTLIHMHSYSGVSFQEFEEFKQDFRWAAFTCRLSSCPSAVSGFENEDLWLAHEATHRRFFCTIPGCQYPPFTSARSLKHHHADCHREEAKSTRRSIRQVPTSKPEPAQNVQKKEQHMTDKFGVTSSARESEERIIYVAAPEKMSREDVPTQLQKREMRGLDVQSTFLTHYSNNQSKAQQGWWQSVQPQERASHARRFFSYYCMLKPDVPEKGALLNAVQFESLAFTGSQTKEQYNKAMKEELGKMYRLHLSSQGKTPPERWWEHGQPTSPPLLIQRKHWPNETSNLLSAVAQSAPESQPIVDRPKDNLSEPAQMNLRNSSSRLDSRGQIPDPNISQEPWESFQSDQPLPDNLQYLLTSPVSLASFTPTTVQTPPPNIAQELAQGFESDQPFSGNTKAKFPQTSSLSQGAGRDRVPISRPVRAKPRAYKVDKFGATLLARECEKGDLAKVESAYFAAPKELDQPDFAGITPLQKAALHGWVDVVEFLLLKGCQSDCESVDKDTPLMDAVANSHLRVVSLLLGMGNANPHHLNKKGLCAIDVLDPDGEDTKEIKKELLAAMERQDQEMLLEKATEGDIVAVRDLIDRNITPNVACGVAAARGGHHAILNVFLAAGLNADPESEIFDGTPMLAAVGRGHLKVIELLLEQDNFDPTRLVRGRKAYYEISEDRRGPKWEQERDILKRAYDRYMETHKRRKRKKTVSKAGQALRRTSSPKRQRSSSRTASKRVKLFGRRLYRKGQGS